MIQIDASPPKPLTKAERQQVYRLFTDARIAKPHHSNPKVSTQSE